MGNTPRTLLVDRALEVSQKRALRVGQEELPGEAERRDKKGFGRSLGGFVAAVDAVGSAGEFHDGCAVDDAVEQGHGQLRVAEILVPGLEVDVGHQGGADTITARVNDLVPQARRVRTQTAFDLVEAKLIDDEQVEAGVVAYALVDRVVSQRRREVFD
jgi:hypothetical protein